MRIHLATSGDDFAFVASARERTCLAIGGLPNSPLARPLPYANHLLAVDHATRRPMGLAESYAYDQACRDYRGTLVENLADSLNHYCRFSQLGSLRTVFIEDAYRGSRVFIYLALLTADLAFHHLGITFATVATSEQLRAREVMLYEKLGGIRVGRVPFPNRPGEELLVLLFDLRQLLQSPLLDRARAIADIDVARAVENRKRRDVACR